MRKILMELKVMIFNYLRGVTISDDHDILTKENVEVKWNEKFKGDPKNYNNSEESALTDNPDGEYTLAGNGIKSIWTTKKLVIMYYIIK